MPKKSARMKIKFFLKKQKDVPTVFPFVHRDLERTSDIKNWNDARKRSQKYSPIQKLVPNLRTITKNTPRRSPYHQFENSLFL